MSFPPHFNGAPTEENLRPSVYNKLGVRVIMNHDPLRGAFFPFHFTRSIRINVHVDFKVFYQQRIVFMFGPKKLHDILASPNPVIIPMIHYENSFDVHIFVLF